MSELSVYRSSHPDVLAAMDAYMTDWRAYRDTVRAILGEHGAGGCKLWATSSGWRPGVFLGIDVPAGEKPPPGWRMGRDYAVPDKRVKAGKAIAAALLPVRHPGDPMDRIPGMPPNLLTAGGFASPGLRKIGGALYVTWRGVDPGPGRESFTGRSGEVDLDLWERVRLSAYYAVVEAEDDAESEEHDNA